MNGPMDRRATKPQRAYAATLLATLKRLGYVILAIALAGLGLIVAISNYFGVERGTALNGAVVAGMFVFLAGMFALSSVAKRRVIRQRDIRCSKCQFVPAPRQVETMLEVDECPRCLARVVADIFNSRRDA
jgi:hypothetical protein